MNLLPPKGSKRNTDAQLTLRRPTRFTKITPPDPPSLVKSRTDKPRWSGRSLRADTETNGRGKRTRSKPWVPGCCNRARLFSAQFIHFSCLTWSLEPVLEAPSDDIFRAKHFFGATVDLGVGNLVNVRTPCKTQKRRFVILLGLWCYCRAPSSSE